MKIKNSKIPIFLLILLVAIACNTQKENQERPNIIFVMVDDLGYADLSSFGQTQYTTPAIDKFVSEGIKFTNAYAAAPYCSPTRVAFMTGKYPAKFQVGLREPLTMSEEDLNRGLSPEIPTLTSILKSNGYKTALFGKWHLGQKIEFLPSKHGIDDFFGIMCGAADHIDHKPFDRRGDLLYKRDIPNLYENDDPVEKEGYLNDLITAYAKSFLSTKHDKPFFLSIQFTAPHWPWQAPNDSPLDSISYSKSGDPGRYIQMIKNLDKNFGDILETLKNSGLDKSTIVIFTNDNGGDRFGDMGLLKGRKGSLFEGGIRVPAAVRWPDKIKPGQQSEQALITMDWTSTILDLSKSIYSDTLKLDGMSLSECFDNPGKVVSRDFYWRITNRKQESAYRSGNLKYLKTDKEEFLFNLITDIGEQVNLKDKMPEEFENLRAAFSRLDREMLDADHNQ